MPVVLIGPPINVADHLIGSPITWPQRAPRLQVPSFDSGVAMELLEQELGAPWSTFYSELTPEPIAAASLGQARRAPPSPPEKGSGFWGPKKGRVQDSEDLNKRRI